MRLMGGPPRLLQALFFERGSQQSLHDDSWYLPSGSQKIAVWVALDDADANNGQLLYIPGSHRRPVAVLNPLGKTHRERITFPQTVHTPIDVQDAARREALEEVRRSGLRQQAFGTRAGDVGILHERLLHEGSPIRDWHRTRRSMVLHYTCER